jgi:hypothetical protein
VTKAVTVRKAIAALKNMQPDVVVAEFNFQSDFRDRTSSLESLRAVLPRHPFGCLGSRLGFFHSSASGKMTLSSLIGYIPYRM